MKTGGRAGRASKPVRSQGAWERDSPRGVTWRVDGVPALRWSHPTVTGEVVAEPGNERISKRGSDFLVFYLAGGLAWQVFFSLSWCVGGFSPLAGGGASEKTRNPIARALGWYWIGEL